MKTCRVIDPKKFLWLESMMQNLTKIGGLAAIGCGLTYVIGFVFLVTVLAPLGAGSDAKDYGAMIAFAAENHAVMAIWNMTI